MSNITDKDRLEWVLENLRGGDIEFTENLTGNPESANIPATREAIDEQINSERRCPAPELWVKLSISEGRARYSNSWTFQPFDEAECRRQGIYRFVHTP